MDLTRKKCVPCEGGVPRVEGAALDALLAAVPGWRLAGDRIACHFRFADFTPTSASTTRR
jgi:4a-hydroxytetrahydrobiopterin dehydratase